MVKAQTHFTEAQKSSMYDYYKKNPNINNEKINK